MPNKWVEKMQSEADERDLSLSQWGQFGPSYKIVRPEMIPAGASVRYSSPLQKWDGERWLEWRP